MNAITIIWILLAASFFPGLVNLTKAKLSGRKGASLFQPVSDIARLLRKGSVYSTTTGKVFQLAPLVYIGTVLCTMLFIPFGTHPGLFSFDGDFVLFAYLLALGRFMMIIGALDTGSGFEGMGANREALYGMLVEPALFIVLASLALLTEHTSFFELYEHIHFGSYLSYLLAGLAIFLLLQISMVENSRMPVDDPKTHLELTMVHEVMVLDHSGFDLGLIQISNALKFAIFGSLMANFLLPETWAYGLHLGIFFGIQILYAITVGLLESFRPRLKLVTNPKFLLGLTAVGFILFFTVAIIAHKFIIP